MHIEVRVGDVNPNPFRDLVKVPYVEEKVAGLMSSIDQTGFWDNVVVRRNDEGEIELAYGHHRVEALRRLYGEDHLVRLIEKDLTDAAMIQVMANENREEWGSSAMVELETLRSVVEAFGAGRIDLAPVPKHVPDKRRRFAPSLRNTGSADPVSVAYTAQTVAEFIGWVAPDGSAQMKVKVGLRALELIELGLMSDADVAGLTTTQLRQLVREQNAILKQQAAKAKIAEQEAERARELAEKADEAEAGRLLQVAKKSEKKAKQAKTEAAMKARMVAKKANSTESSAEIRKIGQDARRTSDNPLPDAAKFTRGITKKIEGFDRLHEKLDALVEHRAHIPQAELVEIVEALQRTAKEMHSYAMDLTKPQHAETA